MTRRGTIENQTNFRFPLDNIERMLYTLVGTNVFKTPAGKSGFRDSVLVMIIAINHTEGWQMRTMYYKTSNFIQHTGNLVDLDEFRRKTAAAQPDSLARQPEPEPWPGEEPAFRPVVLEITPKASRRERRAWALDACASLAVVLMTLLFALRVML